MKRILISIITLLLMIPQMAGAEVIPHKVYAAASKAIDGSTLTKNCNLTFKAINNDMLSLKEGKETDILKFS